MKNLSKNSKFKIVIALLITFGLILIATLLFINTHKNNVYTNSLGISYVAKVEGKSYLVYENGQFKEKFLKGVNIGAAKPGYFPGELGITKDDYYRWFAYISEMNADVIRVYTTMKPDFYEALYNFNQKSKKPLYLIHGVWVNEENINSLADGYNPKIKDAFIDDSKQIIDIIHGNAEVEEQPGLAYGNYRADVSKYVIGWILGIEWYPDFIDGTNNKNPQKNSYSGEYLFANKAPAFECFMAEVGNEVIKYETEKYKTQRPLAFSNWATTDTLKHPNEPSDKEDSSTFNSELIKNTDKFDSGLFASYHIYPYYPDFINYDLKYRELKDKAGKINTYRAYLRDIMTQHTMPVIISEFGLASSRGKTHEEINRGYNQGGHDEAEQGNMNASMLSDIYNEGYSGAILFSWQDEWFKRTWNTMDYDVAERRPYWSNAQTNEQEFGLLAFDPGAKTSICYVDGDISDWKNISPIFANDTLKLWVNSDEKYMYFRVNKKNFDPSKDKLYLPIDTIKNQGNTKSNEFDLTFDKPADFLIVINGEKNSKILVDSYYDSFYYSYAKQLGMIPIDKTNEIKNGGKFNNISLCLNKELTLPQENKVIPFSQYTTGILKLGNGNPKNEKFNSLTDFSYSGDEIEIRIPWALINVSDPSSLKVIDDMYGNKGIKHLKIDGINVGVISDDGTSKTSPSMNSYTWKAWDMPTYHERLKPSYFIMQKAFGELK